MYLQDLEYELTNHLQHWYQKLVFGQSEQHNYLSG